MFAQTARTQLLVTSACVDHCNFFLTVNLQGTLHHNKHLLAYRAGSGGHNQNLAGRSLQSSSGLLTLPTKQPAQQRDLHNSDQESQALHRRRYTCLKFPELRIFANRASCHCNDPHILGPTVGGPHLAKAQVSGEPRPIKAGCGALAQSVLE